VKRQLKTLPSTLEETYDQILLRIEESHRQSALKILKWLAFAAMPVTIEVVAETLAVDLSMEPCYNPDLKPFDPQDILIICSSLVTRVAVSLDDMLETLGTSNAPYLWVYGDFGSEDYEHDAIKLAHLSVKDYLCSDRIRSSKARHFAVDASLAHTFIAQTCLVYLLQPAFASGYCDENGILARNREWPLFHYAVHFWPFHVTISGDVLDDITWHLLLRFFRTKNAANGGNFAAWAVALTPDIALKNIHYTQPLYYAASFGITSLIRKLLDTNPEIDIDAPGGRFECSPLQVATFRHHQTAVKMLLEAGADPMSLNVRGESCLYWAVVQGHVEAEDLLKSYGATLTSRDIRLLNRFREAFPMREFIVTQDS
jgi:hypothetical protein